MRCLSPRTVGFKADGKTISWSPKSYSKEFATFQLPCGKCIECRLDYARQWAIRCVHEAKMHEKNSFITLTYDEKHLESPELQYRDFQLFAKKLRNQIQKELHDRLFPMVPERKQRKLFRTLPEDTQRKWLKQHEISIFVTGEYGDKNKRPHWHALIFNWRPSDETFKYANDRGDRVYSSKTLDLLWGKGMADIGQVTFESAGYCARYAAKKLTHGPDGHKYEPVSKKSSKQAIGKTWLEKHWQDVFNQGQIVLPNGKTTSVPRYYEKWFQKNHPEKWVEYITKTKLEKIASARTKSEMENQKQNRANDLRKRRNPFADHQVNRAQARAEIIKQKFKLLQEKLKL